MTFTSIYYSLKPKKLRGAPNKIYDFELLAILVSADKIHVYFKNCLFFVYVVYFIRYFADFEDKIRGDNRRRTACGISTILVAQSLMLRLFVTIDVGPLAEFLL